MIKELDWEFLKDTVNELWVCYPWEWIDSFNNIYEDIIKQYLYDIDSEMDLDAYNLILDNIFYNYEDTKIDLSLDKFLKEYPQYLDKKSELENILY